MPMRGRRWTGWVHLVVLALALPLACSIALPGFARWVGDAATHVCSCELRAGHSTCGCPLCEHRADLRLHRAAIRGTCGADGLFYGASLGAAMVPPPSLWVVAPDATRTASPRVAMRVSDVFLTPPTPPPRRALS
jgi:hypothetical protein